MNEKMKSMIPQDDEVVKSKKTIILRHCLELIFYQMIIQILLRIAENLKHYHYDPRLKFWMYIVAIPVFFFCLGVFIYRDFVKGHSNFKISEKNKKRILLLLGCISFIYVFLMIPRLFPVFRIPTWWDYTTIAILGALPEQYFRHLYLVFFFLFGVFFEKCLND